MSYKVSVIIPFYNEESYLENCLESVLNQTLDNIEIICINDGSTDNSADIVRQYGDKVKLIVQDNKGQSAARNKGLEIAQGKYIGFLDADDWAEPDMYEKLYQCAKENSADIALSSICVYNENTKEKFYNDVYFSLDILKNTPDIFNYRDVKDIIFKICVVPWNKLYKRELLNNVRFTEGIIFEDNVFFFDTFLRAEKCVKLDEPLVNYRRHSKTSCTSDNNDFKKLDFLRVHSLIEKTLREQGLYEEFKDAFIQDKEYRLSYWYKKLSNADVKKKYQLFYLGALRQRARRLPLAEDSRSAQ